MSEGFPYDTLGPLEGFRIWRVAERSLIPPPPIRPGFADAVLGGAMVLGNRIFVADEILELLREQQTR